MPAAQPATMHAAVLTGFGGPEKLVYRSDVPLPVPQTGEVLIRVGASAVNNTDINTRVGWYSKTVDASSASEGVGFDAGSDATPGWGGTAMAFPRIQGADCCGTIVGVGPGVDAQRTGERVLVHGGTSGLGIIMVQVAKALGAELFATVGSDEKIAFLQPFGVRGINHRTAPFQDQLMQATHGEGVDVIIDTLGAPQLATHFKLLRSGGRMVTLAMLEGNRVESLKIAGFFMKQLRWSAATLRGRTHAQKAEIMAIIRHQLWPHLLSGRIQPVVDSVFPLIDAEIALKKMQERLHMGKILLEVGIGD
jgi:NADPH:quinone reductase-like Zn-dependent oxidoreductase